ncbi:MAG: CBS domain-containing protein [Candidatus Bathyarchaeota archaeon]|nr:MAG: CBS domain-containing protein [Candidatus Bathyarchaeota archaeon]
MSSKYLDDILSLPVQTNMRRMSPTISPSDSVSLAVNEMVKNNIGAVIVVIDSKPVGIITERDVLGKVVQPLKDMDQTLVKDVMSEPIILIEANRSIKEALDLMHKHSIRRLAVTKDSALIGLITERRLLERVLSDLLTPP